MASRSRSEQTEQPINISNKDGWKRVMLCIIVPLMASGLALLALEVQRRGLEALSFVQQFRPRCEPKEDCPWYGIRATLPDGTSASMIFDGPRRLLLGDLRADTKDLVTRVRKPPVIVYDIQNTTTKAVIHTLRIRAREALEQHPLDKHEGKNDALSAILECHFDDEEVNEIADMLVRLAGIPDRHYAEAVIVTEYHGRQNAETRNASHVIGNGKPARLGPFAGCQRIGQVTLDLSENDRFEGGVTIIGSENSHTKIEYETKLREGAGVYVNDDGIVYVAPRPQRVVVVFGVDPVTERYDNTAWLQDSSVTKGTRLTATLRFRNCSHLQVAQRVELLESLNEHLPTSVIVPKLHNGLNNQEDEEDDFEDDEDYDDDDDDDEKFDDIDDNDEKFDDIDDDDDDYDEGDDYDFDDDVDNDDDEDGDDFDEDEDGVADISDWDHGFDKKTEMEVNKMVSVNEKKLQSEAKQLSSDSNGDSQNANSNEECFASNNQCDTKVIDSSTASPKMKVIDDEMADTTAKKGRANDGDENGHGGRIKARVTESSSVNQ